MAPIRPAGVEMTTSVVGGTYSGQEGRPAPEAATAETGAAAGVVLIAGVQRARWRRSAWAPQGAFREAPAGLAMAPATQTMLDQTARSRSRSEHAGRRVAALGGSTRSAAGWPDMPAHVACISLATAPLFRF